MRLPEQALRLQYVGDGGHGLFEGADDVGVLPAQGGEDDGLEVQADGGGIDDGAVAADRPFAFEASQPDGNGETLSFTRAAGSVTVRRPSSRSSARIEHLAMSSDGNVLVSAGVGQLAVRDTSGAEPVTTVILGGASCGSPTAGWPPRRAAGLPGE